jgi:hypothetical protein
VYVDVLPVSLHFLIADSLPEGAVIDPGEFASQQTWEELLAQGQQLCTDAREGGWAAARAALADDVRSQSTESAWNPALDDHLSLLVRAQESAVTAEGSLCPDLRRD